MTVSFRYRHKNVLVMKNQGPFHPTEVSSSSTQTHHEKGGLIFENTTAVNIETGEFAVVLTRGGASTKITAENVRVCSHISVLLGLGLYSTRMHAD